MLRRVLPAESTPLLGTLLDETFVLLALRLARDRTTAVERARLVEAAQRAYEDCDLFPPPGSNVVVDARRSPSRRGLHDIRLTWPSGFLPHCGKVRDDYLGHRANHVCKARLLTRRDTPLDAVIVLHGYASGRYELDARLLFVDWLIGRDLDVAQVTLPFHASRRDRCLRWPAFISSDPRFVIEAIRQSMHDIRCLHRELVRRGARSVGVVGMSLGGYLAALLATIEAQLAFVIPFVPLAALADVELATGRLPGTPTQRRALHRMLDDVYARVSPLARPPLIAGDRVAVLGASGDRITPIDHAARLAAHFGGRLVPFAGTHLLHPGLGSALAGIEPLVRPPYSSASRAS